MMRPLRSCGRSRSVWKSSFTGRDPDEALVELADYVSEIRKVKHPFDRGIRARRGIEY